MDRYNWLKNYVDTIPKKLDSELDKLIERTHTPVHEAHSINFPSRPLEVDEMGNNTWTFLHTMTAHYSSEPTEQEQNAMKILMTSVAKLFPCSMCSQDFQNVLEQVPPNYAKRDNVNKWMCIFHNEVNRRSMKPQFDCSQWEKRWYYNEDCE